ncbi:hypothetical protein Tco_0163357 [Tanacetum coccineum]
MKSGDAGVKNSILTPGGEKKRRIHRISEIRKKYSDNKCDGKIMAILKGVKNSSTLESERGVTRKVDSSSTVPSSKQAVTVADKQNHSEIYPDITHTSMSRTGAVEESKEKKVEGSEETAKGNRKKMLGRKRAGKEQQQESSKKQRMEEDKESDEVEEDDEGELKKHLVIKKDEDIAIDAIPLATKIPMIIDYKLHKEGMMVHYQLIRVDGSSKRYYSMIRMLQGIDREDLEALWRIVKTKYSDIRPEDEFERVLWGDLKVMFEPDKRSDVWRILQGYRCLLMKGLQLLEDFSTSQENKERIKEDKDCLGIKFEVDKYKTRMNKMTKPSFKNSTSWWRIIEDLVKDIKRSPYEERR